MVTRMRSGRKGKGNVRAKYDFVFRPDRILHRKITNPPNGRENWKIGTTIGSVRLDAT